MIDLELFSTLSSKNAFQPRNSMFLAFLPKGLSTESLGFFFPFVLFSAKEGKAQGGIPLLLFIFGSSAVCLSGLEGGSQAGCTLLCGWHGCLEVLPWRN